MMLMPDTCKCEYFVLVSPILKQVYNSLEGLTQCEAKLMRHKIKNKCLQNAIKLQQNLRFPLVKLIVLSYRARAAIHIAYMPEGRHRCEHTSAESGL